MTDAERTDDGAGGLSRRSLLQAAAMGAATGSSAVGLVEATDDLAEDTVLADPEDLGSWVVMRNHEVPVFGGTAGNPPVANVDGRFALRTTYGFSHVNTKVPDGPSDVARPECGGEPGIQHRFVATTFTMCRGETSAGTYPIRAVEDLSISAVGPGSDCGSVSFALNNSFQHRTSTAAFQGEGSSDFGEYDGGELRSAVADRARSKSVSADPTRPTDPDVAKETAELVFNTALVAGAAALGPIGAAAVGLAGPFVADALVDVLFDTCEYEPNQRLRDNYVTLEQDQLDCGAGEEYAMVGSAAINLVDFTVTVEPGETRYFTVDHGVDYNSLDKRGALTDDNTRTVGDVSIGDGTNTGAHMKGDHTWSVEVPGIELGTSVDDLGGDDLPSTNRSYDDPPEPEIELAGDASFDDLSAHDTVTFEATGVSDLSEGRWRVYQRAAGPIRPAIDYGTEFTWRFDQSSSIEETSLEDPAFGPGEYAVEFVAFDEPGVAGSARREFTVDPAGDRDVRLYASGELPDGDTWSSLSDDGDYNGVVSLSADEGRPDQLGRTVTVDGTDSPDPFPNPSATDGIDNYVWQVETPGDDEVRWTWSSDGRIDVDVEEPGQYVIQLTTFSFRRTVDGFSDVNSQLVAPLFDDDGTPDLDSTPGETNAGTLERLKEEIDTTGGLRGGYASGTIILSQNAPPEASIDVPSGVEVGQDGTFDASGSSDPDGEVDGYAWAFAEPGSFDADSPPETPDEFEAAGAPVPDEASDDATRTRDFFETGTWAAGVRVTDDRGGEAFAAETFEIEDDGSPSISVASDTVATNSEIEFTGEPGGDQREPGLTYEWRFEGPFDAEDRTPSTTTREGKTVDKTFFTPGRYVVTLAVTGDERLTTTISVTARETIEPSIEVVSEYPTTADPVRVVASSNLASGTVEWEWYVEDVDDPLSNLDPGSEGPAATGRVADLEFDEPGEYRVVLRGRRDELVATTSEELTVRSGGLNAVIERVDADEPYADPDEEAVFTALDSFDDDGEVVAYTWYVDGEEMLSGEDAVQLSHSFEDDGDTSKPVAVVVADDDGNTDRAVEPIFVRSDEERFGPDAELRLVAPSETPVPPETTATFSAGATTDPEDDVESYEYSVDGDVVRRADADDAFDEREPPERLEYSFDAPDAEEPVERTVSVLVRDAEGYTDTASVTVPVLPAEEVLGPTAALTLVDPADQPVPPGETVEFSAAESTNPDGPIQEYEYSVDGELIRQADREDVFRDREAPEVFEYSFDEPEEGPTEDHTVSVLVRNDDGYTDTAELAVTVEAEDDEFAGTEVIERGSDPVYQTGRIVSHSEIVSGEVTTVTGRVEAEIPAASDNVVYGVLGFPDGTIVDVVRMDRLGTGYTEHGFTILERWNREGDALVWSFYAVLSGRKARQAFAREAGRDRLAYGDNGIVVGVVEES